jgi:fructose-bisphosphate aldolase class I
MDNDVQGMPTTKFLWDKRGVVPFLKIDKGLEAETDGVQLMKPIPGLDALLQRAAGLGVFGTKMRSVINTASKTGIAAVVKQQFEIGEQISGHGLMPIIEPEISIKSPSKADCEAILRDEILSALKTLPAGRQVMLKLTIPDAPNFYAPLIDHPGVLKVVALSGGYTRDDACERLAENKGMIASFSRALVEDLTYSMTDPAFDAALAHNIEEIYQASVSKH